MGNLTLWERFLLDKKKYLSSLSAFILGSAILIVYGQSGPSQETYLEAESAFEKWVASPKDEILFKNMQAALDKVPQLESKYNPIIAQTLLDRAERSSEAERAISFALKSLGPIQQEAPFHAAYAANSLYIEKGAYQEALQRAVLLKEEMTKGCDLQKFKEEPRTGGSLLYAYNLVRIAFLQQKLANRPGEKAAWLELEDFVPNSHALFANFREKGVDLTDYIAERKKQL